MIGAALIWLLLLLAGGMIVAGVVIGIIRACQRPKSWVWNPMTHQWEWR